MSSRPELAINVNLMLHYHLNHNEKLHPIPPPDEPWHHIGIDLVCDLLANKEGYKHLLVTVCYLSKFCAVRPLRTKTSKEVLTQLKKYLYDFRSTQSNSA